VVEIFGFEITREALIRALVILVLASMPSVAWFFKVRRKMIEATVRVIRSLEDAVRPRDQRYWLHGYLVGFAAKYWVRRGAVDKVYVNFTMPPYHAFFYLPVILLFRKRERLEVAVEYSRPLGVRGEAHVFDERKRSVRVLVERDIASTRSKGFEKGYVVVAGKRMAYYSRPGGALELAVRLAESLSALGEVYRVSVIPSRRMILALVTPSAPSAAGEVARILMEGWRVESVAGGREEAPS
jgi:hypothetical protein